MPRDLEKELNTLRKRKENKQCPNCAAEDRYGFKSACVKFDTFVCGDCKAGHQAISHRIKGVSMSTFTEDEVDRLRERGNRHAQQTWLGRLTRAEICDMCPRKDDRPEVWHKWIERIYEHREFYLEPGAASDRRDDRDGGKASRDERQRGDRGRYDDRRDHRRTARPHANTAPSRYDDDGFGTLAGGSSSDPFGDDPFGSESSTTNARLSGATDPFAELASGSTTDPFGDFDSGAKPAVAPTQSVADSFDPFGSSAPVTMPAAAPAAAPASIPADDFFGAMTPAPAPTGSANGAPADDFFGAPAPAPVSTSAPATTPQVTTDTKNSIMGLFSQPAPQQPVMSQPMGMMQPQQTMMMQPQQTGMMQQGMMQQGVMQPQQMGMMQQGIQPQGMMMRQAMGMQPQQMQQGMMPAQQGIVQPQQVGAPGGQIGSFF